MGDVKDVSNLEGVEKIKKLAKEADACLFCTKIETGKPFSMRPMNTRDIDDNGNLWFLSDKNSTKNMELKEDDKVQLLLGILTPTLILPAVTLVDIFSSMVCDTIVSPPGQYLFASNFPILPNDTIFSTSFILDAKIGSGFFLLLPFILKILSTESSLYGLQPMP